MTTVNKVIVKTKSNFRNLNGKELDVKEVSGKRISCSVYDEEIGKTITIDFNINEIVEFKN